MTTRHPFGGGVADWVQLANESNVPVLQPGATLTFWNAREGGTQYLDLAADALGETPLTAVVSSDGTDGYDVGAVPVFYGPPDVTAMWMSADGGNRVAVGAIDSADLAGQFAVQLAQHVSDPNPHGTSVATLTDTDVSAPVDGAVLAYDATAAKWEAASTTGLNPAAFVATAGGSTIRIADGDTTTTGLTVRIPAGDRSAAPNTLQTYWNAGTDEAPDWVPTTEFNEYGELRVQASATNRVPVRVKRRSSGQTADLQQWTTEGNVPLAYVTAAGLVRAPNVGRTVTFSAEGDVVAGEGRFFYTNLTQVSQVLAAHIFRLNTAASSGTLTFDIMLNGTTLYPSGKPSLAAGATSTGVTTSAFTIPVAGVIRVDVTGTFADAADLTCQLEII